MTQPINAAGKIFSWSPSKIADFINCPASYAARHFYLTLPYKETEEMKQGTIEHKHLENRIKFGTKLPEGYERGEKYCRVFLASQGKVEAEQELAIDENLKFVSWFDKSAFGRCKIDLSVILPRVVACYDWKTGNIKEDSLQLKINACFLALRHADAEEFITRYIWLKHDAVTPKDGNFTRDDLPKLWDEILGWVERMKAAWRSENFPPRPSGLCRNWCHVTTCPHCGKGR